MSEIWSSVELEGIAKKVQHALKVRKGRRVVTDQDVAVSLLQIINQAAYTERNHEQPKEG